MIIKRVLTNNSVVIEENGIEKIVCGKGIAFKKETWNENRCFIDQPNFRT